ncbi:MULTISPECIES: cytochrome P450 [unclassified Streptomyces]|uniref:cytochrome P450 n=1 Tax=unclassified Streptomyces TaxID=2593676 RepID=UPI002252CB87|nr:MULTISPECIES: cytochrome P450 [unclassified Streptomyces]WSP58921.1 cytochrome P450 [Streptomyces sp. NBC_01241]WSU20560.1 cytochrome P450 [Streptomyces sp. NBC_01108]MCX4790651.1 cytochrome P450 [Streptomyces sp. NBC_01221]MCX4793619.1 cytochrome P450 [Streptomyces sp. NBC_01242]WSJ35047.1 cytochrome P450 [Streptomyces sp. NBC_01321]
MTPPSSAVPAPPEPDATPGGDCAMGHGPAAVPLSGPEFHTDPQVLYRTMRRDHGPVVPVELPGGFPAWLVIGYRELHQVTSDGQLFPRDVGLWNQWEHIPEDWPLLPMVGRPMPSIYFTAGAEHRRHAEMVVPALEGADPFEIRRHCEELADRLIDDLCTRGSAELVAEFAEPLPVLVLARLIGFPDAEGADIARVLKELADGGPGAQSAHARFGEHMQRLVAAKRAAPGNDVTTRMMAHHEPFTDEEYVLDLMAVTAAGHLPTADWISNSLRLMLTDDQFADSLFGGRHSIGEAMNEVLWEESPTPILAGRWAARDTRLAGRDIKAGDMLLLGLGAANSDPHVRQHLSTGHPSGQRGNSAHLAFSHGEYRCPFPAQEIAEITARTGIEVLLDRLPDLALAVPEETLVRRQSAFLRGMESLPVLFTPVRTTGDVS